MSDSEEDIVDKKVKLVFVGDTSVGKTCIVKRFCHDEFSRQYTPTVGADFYMKRKKLSGQNEIILKISDIGGQELSGNMLDKYLFDADIIVLVYDITNLSSFEGLTRWLSRVQVATEASVPPIVAIIGNKCDMEHQRAVRMDRCRQFANEHGLLAQCVLSARTGESVVSCIMDLVAHRLGIVLSKTEQERHKQKVMRAELGGDDAISHHRPSVAHVHNSTGICIIS